MAALTSGELVGKSGQLPWEAARAVAPGMPSCGTCQHWEQQQDGDGRTRPLYGDPTRGYCHAITHGGQHDADAEIEGGGQGVSEPVELETREWFFCSMWKARP